MMGNSQKIILDLCGGTGSWSKPYVEVGYDVRLITLPENDVRLLDIPKENIYGILAAPPCTYFCRMRMCRGRPTDEMFADGLSVVSACLRIITMSSPKFWALENPQGYLNKWLGEPNLKFHPYEFGDAWTKNTWIWGNFSLPIKNPVEPKGRLAGNKKGDKAIAQTFTERARTPQGFAKAFFEANQ